MKEIWKDVKGYEGYYQISNLGRVKSLPLQGIKKTVRILKPQLMPNYYCVQLCKNGIVEIKRVHRLMAEAFIPNLDNKPQINHKNGIKIDNRLDNLEWCNASENQLHARSMGLVSNSRTRRKPMKKIIQKSIDNKIIKIWESNKQIAIETNYKKENIKGCCNGRNKTAYGYKWEYVK